MKFHRMIFLLLAVASLISCSQKQKVEEQSDQADDSEWAEMDSFHLILAEAFHPYKDSANLEPVKRLAGEMADHAEEWVYTALPDKVNNDDMQMKLNQLKTDTRVLYDKITAGASDEEIGSLLSALHEGFHGIMEAWSGEGHQHKH